VVGMVWVVQMISPALRCHHISGSSNRDRTVKAGQHDWKRENPWQETNVCSLGQRGRTSHAILAWDLSGSTNVSGATSRWGSTSRSKSGTRIKRCK
jgi:hypothetical protein